MHISGYEYQGKRHYCYGSYHNVEYVVELLHTTTINTLNSIRLSLAKHIENLESKNEWITDNASQEAIDKAKAYASSILVHCSNLGRAYVWRLYARLKIWRSCFDYKSTH